MPSNATIPYQDATLDIYKDMRQILAPFFDIHFGKVHAGKGISALMKEVSIAAALELVENLSFGLKKRLFRPVVANF